MKNFLLIGKAGMNKAVWKKMFGVRFGATYKPGTKSGIDAGILEVDLDVTFQTVKETIGPIIIKRYEVQFK